MVPRTHGRSPRGEGTATNLPARLHVPKATLQLQHVPGALLQLRAGCGMGARRHAPGPPRGANARRVPGHRCAGAVCCPSFYTEGGLDHPTGGSGFPFCPLCPRPLDANPPVAPGCLLGLAAKPSQKRPLPILTRRGCARRFTASTSCSPPGGRKDSGPHSLPSSLFSSPETRTGCGGRGSGGQYRGRSRGGGVRASPSPRGSPGPAASAPGRGGSWWRGRGPAATAAPPRSGCSGKRGSRGSRGSRGGRGS